MKTARWQPRSPASELQLFIRIKHPSLDPTEISHTLDAAPEEAIEYLHDRRTSIA
jgi:hypothetical protein